MAILVIKKFNEPVLREKCRKVRRVDKKIRKLIVDMAQTIERNQGVGLAAPQVGILKRIIIVKTDVPDQRIFELINPKITKKSKEIEKGEEGCLSFPGIFLKIKRAKEVEVEGLDIKGKKIKIRIKGILARVFQHEIDHLDGVLFLKRLSFFQKLKFKLKHPRLKL